MARSQFDPSEHARRSQIEQQPTAMLPAAGMPVEQQPTAKLPNAGLPEASSSRRTFLKATVVASATVAAAGGVAGAALVTGEFPSPSLRFVGGVVSGDPCRGCITGSNYQMYTAFTVNSNGQNANPGTFFLWFTDHAPPSGSYDVTVQIKKYALNSGTSVLATYTLGDSNAPFIFKASGNNAYAFKVANAQDCPTSAPSGQISQAHTLADMMPINFAPPSGGTCDLQIYAHIDWYGQIISTHVDDTQRFDFIITFKNHSSGKTLCTETVTITAQQA